MYVDCMLWLVYVSFNSEGYYLVRGIIEIIVVNIIFRDILWMKNLSIMYLFYS